MPIRVELVAPLGELRPPTGLPVKTGRRGWTTGAWESGKPMVKFDRRSEACAVPEHWLRYIEKKRKG